MMDIRYTTLFLDRDGVINEKIDGYVKTYSEFKFIDGVLESLKHLSEYFKNNPDHKVEDLHPADEGEACEEAHGASDSGQLVH